MPEYQLSFAFPDQSPSYAHGFAAGRIWQRMSSSDEPIKDIVLQDLRPSIEAMAMAKGWQEQFTNMSDDWMELLLTKPGFEPHVNVDLSAKRECIDWENRKIDDVLRELEIALRNAGIPHIGDSDNFYRRDRRWGHSQLTKDDIWPCWQSLGEKGRCWPACYPVRGGNEGYYAHIDVVHVVDGKMVTYPITFVKVWSWKEAYEISVLSARILDSVI